MKNKEFLTKLYLMKNSRKFKDFWYNCVCIAKENLKIFGIIVVCIAQMVRDCVDAAILLFRI